ncbi:uncharacterized protein LOC111218572 isoform X1 [Seriola dumerili]|uniref:uncharacterized protein LOC111218572 isoform X1 n=1 Tax=Seriola dumerili TaxID=41447 RepID=UPI000BBE6CC1|nr:uncharacterized protein LOC111218572 isoform X1 [Seriola dumerili]
MFRRDQAALLSIQLLLMCHVFADYTNEHRNILVSRGDPVMFTCNVSIINVTQINWTKQRFLFSYSIFKNLTFSNFTSDGLKIDSGFPSTLNIFNAQHDDTGLYRCDVNGVNGTSTATWNLTVSEKPEEMTDFHSWYLLYILTTVTGLLLCGITSAVCLCRIRRTRTQNQDSAQDQFHLQSGGEVVLTQLQDDTDSRRNNKRSQYMERLNSIYGF